MATKKAPRTHTAGPAAGNTQKDPEAWKTGDEPMTGAQKSYLGTLSEEAGTKVDEDLTKAEASERIDELRGKHIVEKRTDDAPDASNTQKDPARWATGDEPMTGAQKSYLQTLSEEVGEKFDDSLTKAQASQRIDELKKRNPRTKSA